MRISNKKSVPFCLVPNKKEFFLKRVVCKVISFVVLCYACLYFLNKTQDKAYNSKRLRS